MRWSAVIGASVGFLAGSAQAGEWVRIETTQGSAGWGVDRTSVTRTRQGVTRAWFIRALPPIGEDSPDYRLSLEAFDCARYVRVTETATDYTIESYGVFPGQTRTVNLREEVIPGTLGYSLLEAACTGDAYGAVHYAERDFVESFRRDWAAENELDEPPYQVGDLAPFCLTGGADCEIWDRNWRGRGLVAGARVDWSGRIVVD